MSSSGPNAPGTMASVDYSGRAVWNLPNNAKASDNSWTSAGPAMPVGTDWLVASNFGFAIPSGATIDGIEVAVERKANVNAAYMYITDGAVYLMKAGAVTGSDKATTTHWPTTEAVATYGGAADVWGATLSAEDVNDSGFGVELRANVTKTGKTGGTSYVDFISITVTYTEGGGGGVSIPVVMHHLRQQGIA